MIKKLAKKALHYLPDEGRALKAGYHKARMGKDLAMGAALRHLSQATLPPRYEKFMIDPKRIDYHATRKTESVDWEDWVFDMGARTPSVAGGDWDEPMHRVADMRVVKAVAARIHQGLAWPATEYYRYATAQIEGGQRVWGCSTREDFDRHCAHVDEVIQSIKTGGYKESNDPATARANGGFSEIVVNIGRDGRPRFQDGRHRLAIALALQLSAVPVQVLVRHQEWQAFREVMHRMAKGDGGAGRRGVLYQSPTHFDLSDIPCEHACEDRWQAIRSHLPPPDGLVLDIGCNLGYFCQGLDATGYRCVGVEYLPDVAVAARKIALAEGRDIRIVTGDILTPDVLEEVGSSEFSIVMALNIFHHFIKSREGYERLAAFLKRIRAQVMFFEPHLPTESQMAGSYANPAPLEFVRLVQDWSGFAKATPIYQAEDGRTVFKLERGPD